MRWRRFLAIIGLSTCIALSVSVSYQMRNEQSVLKIATAPDYCPYEFLDSADEPGEPVGFDIDIARKISRALGFTPEFEQMHFNNIFVALRSEDVDFAISAITPTPERKEIVDFSSIYYEAKSVIVSRQPLSVDDLNEMAGKRIGAKPGTVHELVAREIPDSEVIPFEHVDDALRALKTGRIDLLVMDEALTDDYLKQHPILNLLMLENSDPAGVAIAFPKHSPLKSRVESVLQRLDDDGTIDELIYKWFDEYVCLTPEENKP